MKIKLQFFALLVSLVICFQSLYSQTRDNIYVISTCDSIMKEFLGGDYSKAMKVLKANSGLGNKVDQIETTVVDAMSTASKTYGKAVSYKFILERNVADIVKKSFYLLMFEDFFLKFDFTWYKSAKGWRIVNFNFDENLTDVLY